LPRLPGSYVLIMRCTGIDRLTIGRLGILRIRKGYYLYAGSACGPGGIRARVHHHLAHSSRPHWHLDYLRPAVDLIEVWYSTDPERLEHRWAGTLRAGDGCSMPLPGFGSSDCSCIAHLFYSKRKPRPEILYSNAVD